ncbi:MAG: alcohol dehydrogenase catalytic domain-containing protein [Elusimicrobia bacterium]|nr:alcohol dehydrogenase catalytic domain-containing protein [Elusimicrobiota bacterium]MBU2614629.1 alcohol dehydrogenase catalytic domain-containing protein [Elusimicrobiota bacterium]
MQNKFQIYGNIEENIIIPKKMKAVLMSQTGLENLKLGEVDIPQPNDNQLLVRVDACTICPSTMKLLSQGPEHTFVNGWDIEKYPITPGDEGSVTAVKVGKNLVKKYKVGERLCIQPAVDCPPINHRERYRNVEAMKKTAVGYTLGGHLSQYMLVQEEVLEANCLLKIPSQSMGYYEVSLSEPLSCVVSSQDHHVHLTFNAETGNRVPMKGLLKGGVTVIFGAGVMGRFHIESALSYSPRKIIVLDIREDRFQWIEKYITPRAKKKGIDLHCVVAGKDDTKNVIQKISGQNYGDDIIEASGSGIAQKEALKITGKGSVVNSFGGLKIEDAIIPVDMRKVHYDESIITGSSGGNWGDTVKTLNMINSGDLQVGTYIKLVGDLNNAVEFLNLVNQAKIDGKAIVYPHAKADKPLEVKDEWTREKEAEFLEKNLK